MSLCPVTPELSVSTGGWSARSAGVLRGLSLALLLACSGAPESVGDAGPRPDSGPLDSPIPGERDSASPDTESPPQAPILQLPVASLRADQLGIVVNEDDPLSRSIAEAYAEARGIPRDQIFSLPLGAEAVLSREAFSTHHASLSDRLPDEIQALLLTFYQPYRVDCMGAAAAFGLGFDEDYCSSPCSETLPSDYYDSESVAPWTDYGIRPAMMLSGDSLEEAEALIQRGLAAEESRPEGHGWLIRTTDSARSVRFSNFRHTAGEFDPDSLSLSYVDNSDGKGSDLLQGEEGVMFYLTGLQQVDELDSNQYRPGALADHLTSYGGVLSPDSGQMPITDWLKAGVTASYGTAVEPCNYREKFPEASVLLSHYFRGATAIEAYWKSVAWPGEGNWVGDPLARPWGHDWSWEDGRLQLETSYLPQGSHWMLQGADSEDGPWETVLEEIGPGSSWSLVNVLLEEAWRPWYRLQPVTDAP